MINQPKEPALDYCRRLIEEKINWGSSESWSTQDFEYLGEQIEQQTGVSLSVTTLKRVWGRVKYTSAPTTTTLNTLAAFLGYATWREFGNVQQNGQASAAELPVIPEAAQNRYGIRSFTKRQKRIAAGLLGLGVSIGVFLLNHFLSGNLASEDFAFSSHPVTKGIPNSVVFRYDASASPTDSVFIQQSWDERRRQWVPKNRYEHTSIYYYPGYFRAKLVIGKQIVQEHDLLIPSDGWVVAVMQEPVPVYYEPNEVIRNGTLNLPVQAIESRSISMQPKPPVVRYRNVCDFRGLRNDNFIFETRLKSDFKQGSAICQHVQMVILCKNDVFVIPLSATGCVGNLYLSLAGAEASAKNTDLSGLGGNLSQWMDVRCEVRSKQVTLSVNGKKAYQTVFPNDPTDIVGISYEFEGTGSVDYTRFSRLTGEVVFADEFETSTVAELETKQSASQK